MTGSIKITNKSKNGAPERYAGENIFEVAASIEFSASHLIKGYGWRIVENEIVIEPGGMSFVGTGLFVDIKQGYELEIRQICYRLTKKGLIAIQDYVNANHKGELYVIVHNASSDYQTIKDGEAIAHICARKASDIDIDWR